MHQGTGGLDTVTRGISVTAEMGEQVDSRSVVSDPLRPHGLHSPWNSSGLNIGLGSLSLLQGIFPTQASKQVSHIADGFFTS